MLGNVLKLIRIANDDMSIKDVTKGTGLSNACIYNIEKGARNVSFDSLTRLSSFYNIPASQIVAFDELQEEKKLSYQETLIAILKYYVEGKRIENNRHENEIEDSTSGPVKKYGAR